MDVPVHPRTYEVPNSPSDRRMEAFDVKEFPMIVEYGKYQLRPFTNGLCWQLYEWRTVHKGRETQREDWCPVDCYPTSLSGGLYTIYERVLKETPYDQPLDLKQAVSQARRIEKSLVEAVKCSV